MTASPVPPSSIPGLLRYQREPDEDLLALLRNLPQRVAAADGPAVVYRARNVLTLHQLAETTVVVKSFGPGRWWRPGGHKAELSFDHATEARRRGVDSPEPLAAVSDTGPWRDHYVCAWIANCANAWPTLDGTTADPAADRRRLAAFVADMHEAGVDHRDLTPGNVLRDPAGRLVVVDTNRMAFHPGPVPLAAALAALAKLDRDGVLVLDYARARRLDPDQLRRHFASRNRWERLTRAAKDATRPMRRRLGL